MEKNYNRDLFIVMVGNGILFFWFGTIVKEWDWMAIIFIIIVMFIWICCVGFAREYFKKGE